jgi:uncharacterized membrane protein
MSVEQGMKFIISLGLVSMNEREALKLMRARSKESGA